MKSTRHLQRAVELRHQGRYTKAEQHIERAEVHEGFGRTVPAGATLALDGKYGKIKLDVIVSGGEPYVKFASCDDSTKNKHKIIGSFTVTKRPYTLDLSVATLFNNLGRKTIKLEIETNQKSAPIEHKSIHIVNQVLQYMKSNDWLLSSDVLCINQINQNLDDYEDVLGNGHEDDSANDETENTVISKPPSFFTVTVNEFLNNYDRFYNFKRDKDYHIPDDIFKSSTEATLFLSRLVRTSDSNVEKCQDTRRGITISKLQAIYDKYKKYITYLQSSDFKDNILYEEQIELLKDPLNVTMKHVFYCFLKPWTLASDLIKGADMTPAEILTMSQNTHIMKMFADHLSKTESCTPDESQEDCQKMTAYMQDRSQIKAIKAMEKHMQGNEQAKARETQGKKQKKRSVAEVLSHAHNEIRDKSKYNRIMHRSAYQAKLDAEREEEHVYTSVADFFSTKVPKKKKHETDYEKNQRESAMIKLAAENDEPKTLLSWSWRYRVNCMMEALRTDPDIEKMNLFICALSLTQGCVNFPKYKITANSFCDIIQKSFDRNDECILVSLALLHTETDPDTNLDVFKVGNLERIWCIFELMYAWLLDSRFERIKIVIYHCEHKKEFAKKFPDKFKKLINNFPGSSVQNPIGVWQKDDVVTIKKAIVKHAAKIGKISTTRAYIQPARAFEDLLSDFLIDLQNHLWKAYFSEGAPTPRMEKKVYIYVEEPAHKGIYTD